MLKKFMKRILMICVNYNTYDQLLKFMDSLDESLMNSRKDLQVCLCIADNSSLKKDVDISVYMNFEVKLYSLNNWGYWGGASTILQKVDIEQYDYISISNVDLLLDKSFWDNFLLLNVPENVGWIAPSIYSELEQRDKNPKIQSRYSRNKMFLFQLLYKYPIFHKLYIATFYKRKKIRTCVSEKKMIYAGHGSFIILTKHFFSSFPNIDYPVFLFGEEIFLAELMLRHNLKVWYVPSLKIWDIEHSSTGAIKKKSYYYYNYEAITYLKNTFYE